METIRTLLYKVFHPDPEYLPYQIKLTWPQNYERVYVDKNHWEKRNAGQFEKSLDIIECADPNADAQVGLDRFNPENAYMKHTSLEPIAQQNTVQVKHIAPLLDNGVEKGPLTSKTFADELRHLINHSVYVSAGNQ